MGGGRSNGEGRGDDGSWDDDAIARFASGYGLIGFCCLATRR